ncbi:MAG: HD domain-containing protein [Lachnospiraceae bacterium]|nr:HD domain-containing protein [Lachnospiraceae bacterium]
MKVTVGKNNKLTLMRAMVVLLSVIMNVALSFLAQKLDLPLYFDTVGTIFASSLGGIFLGVLVAVISNVLCTFFNSYAIYYTIVSLVIAVCTAWFVKKKRFKKKRYVLNYILTISIIGGAVGMVFQWLLQGGPQFEEVANLSENLTLLFKIPYFLSTILVSVGINILDKTATTVLALIALVIVPSEKRKQVWESGWRQTPLTEEQIKELRNKSGIKGRSLRIRMSGMLIIAALLIAISLTYIIERTHYESLKVEARSDSLNSATFLTQITDGDQISDYIMHNPRVSTYDDSSYRKINELMLVMKNAIAHLEDLYIVRVRADGLYMIFDVDEEFQKSGRVGDYSPVTGMFEVLIDDFVAGKNIGEVDYGIKKKFVLASFVPIYDSSNRVVAYACADVVIDSFFVYFRQYILQTGLVFSGIFMLILAYGLSASGYYLIFPIGSMVKVLKSFGNDSDSQEEYDEGVRALRRLDIHTNDEVEELYDSICAMAADTAEQMRSVRQFAAATTRMQNGLIITMADLVENRDKDTGAHIQKTAAYVKIIAEGLMKKGYYPEKINKKFISEIVVSAPLHDIGKINIPDSILDKPGKLTKEEYEIMKTHTIAGQKIMEKAIDTVSGDNYLKEAMNMAAYHHERWDGSGYPYGLHGQVIPLSARIMAVADVFDALTSKRVYKDAMPMDKAFEIIENDSGKQFDPKCVEVFKESLAEVKEVLCKYQE